MTVAEISRQVREGERTAVEVTQSALAEIERTDSDLHAFVRVMKDEALIQAEEVDSKKEKGSLAGVPVALKDNLCTKGLPTSCGSKSLEKYVPPYDAHVVEKLREAGAILIGKTNMDEFGMGSSTEFSSFGPTRNPVDPDHVPGGSSGGSAAAVASGQVPVALGSDTGGSIRQPGSFTGTVGFKPTYGRVSRYGLVAFASSFDQVGPLARKVDDARRVFDVIAGADARDATSVDRPRESWKGDLSGVKVGVPREFFPEGLDSEVASTVRAAIGKVETSVSLSLPMLESAISVYYLIAMSEASSNLARYEGVHYGHRSDDAADLLRLHLHSRREGFGEEVKRRILLGTYALSSGYQDAYYNHALKIRRLLHDDFRRTFEEVDVIVGPTCPTAAFRFGEKVDDPLAMYLSDVFTVGANLAGLPAISIPCGKTAAGLPVGLQIMGKPYADDRVLGVAEAFEKALEE